MGVTVEPARADRPVRVYTPESPIRHPRTLFSDAVRDLRASRMLARRLASRDISGQYRQTMLGYVWAILPAAMITLVWVVLNGANIVHVAAVSVPYPVYALTGTVFWQLFVDSLNAPLNQLSGNRAMLVRVRFPPEALLISGAIQVSFSFLIKLLLLGAVVIGYGVSVQWTAVFVFVPASAFLILGTVVGVLIAPLGLLYKDISQALIAVIGPLMFLTPVVYPPPETGVLATIMHYNPLTPLFEVTRAVLYEGGAGKYMAGFLAVYGAAVGLAFIGWFIYRLAMPVLIERLDA